MKWIRIGGSNTINDIGNYSIGGYPGSRQWHSMIVLNNNSILIFGGDGYDNSTLC